MKVILDSDVQSVLEFMQCHISAHKLVGVATAVNSMAPIFWGHFEAEPVQSFELIHPSIGDLQPAAKESAPVEAYVGGDFAAAEDGRAQM